MLYREAASTRLIQNVLDFLATIVHVVMNVTNVKHNYIQIKKSHKLLPKYISSSTT